MRGVRKTTNRHGATYHHHRATGTRLPDPDDNLVGFLTALERLNAAITDNAGDVTPRGLIKLYKTSPEFSPLADRTRTDYDKVFQWLDPMAGIPIRQMDPPLVIQIRDKAFKQRQRSFANYVVTCLSILFNWGIPRGQAENNPADKVPKIPRPEDMVAANRPWTPEELKPVREAARGGVRVAVAPGAYAGMRAGDAVTVTWSAVQDGALRWTQRKTGQPVWLPIRGALDRILRTAEKTSITVVANACGKPFTADGFRASFFKLIRRLEDAGKVDAGLTFHGLRHTVGALLAEAGADKEDIAAVLGHASTQATAVYTRDAGRKRRAKATVIKLKG